MSTVRTRKWLILIESARSILRKSLRSAGPAKVEAIPFAEARPGTPHPMDKILGHLGNIEVDHVGHVGHIDAPGGHIGSHKHTVPSLAEVAQGLVPLELRTVAVNLDGRMP